MKRAILLPYAAVAAMLACQGDHPAAPQPPRRIATAILDGGHGSGNAHFFWLPPMVPSLPAFSGVFNANLAPKIDVCLLSTVAADGTCTAAFKTFTTKVCPFNPWNPWAWVTCIQTYIQVFPQAQAYAVVWNTGSAPPAAFYRITASVGSQLLGYADAQLVTSEDQLEAVDRTQFVPLVRGWPFLIDFRIEQGATCIGNDCKEQTVGPAGGSVITPNGLAAAFFPAGYFTQPVTVTVSQVPVPCLNTPYAQFPYCYSYTTSPAGKGGANCSLTAPTAANCARVEVCTTVSPSDPNYSHLALFQSDPGVPARALTDVRDLLITCSRILLGPARVSDLANAGWSALERLLAPSSLFAASAMAHNGLGGLTCCFSNMGWALPLQMLAVSSTTITGVSGAQVPQRPGVQAQYLHNTDGTVAPGVPVTFSASEGNGIVTGAAQVTAASGRASVGGWRLPNADNVPYTLLASGPVTAPVTFTATGTTITGTVTETVNDAVTGITGTIAPWLTSATATAGGGNLTLSVTVGAGTFDAATNHFIFSLDTDRNPATGYPGVDANGHTTYPGMGTDYLVQMGSTSEGVVLGDLFSGGTAKVLKYAGGSWTQVATAPVTLIVGAGGVLSTTIPLSAFENWDGQMNFVVVVQTQYLPLNCPTGITVCYTGIEDYLPNAPTVAGIALPSP